MKIRVADYIMNYLSKDGVDTVFLLSGGGMMHLVDAVGHCEGMNYICNHHEQASAMAADGYARQKGKLGVCLATSGPGGTNLVTGIVGAYQDSSPVLYLTGQSKTTQTIQGSKISGLRQFGTFEVDIVPIIESVTKYSVMIMDPKTIKYHLQKAIHLAKSGRPGPVLLDIPLDIQGATVDTDDLVGFEPPVTEKTDISAALNQVVDLLGQAKSPVILAGQGVRQANATEQLKRLVEQLGIPVVTTQLGKDSFAYSHPLFIGHPGPKGDRAGNFSLQTADVIISIGCSLHSQTTGWENDLFAPNAKIVQVEIDNAVLQREEVGVALKIEVDALSFIEQLLVLKAPKLSIDDWHLICKSWKEKYRVINEPHIREDNVVNYYDVAEILNQHLPSDACLVTDAGSAFYVMGQGLHIHDEQRFISSGSLGAMGFALPAAVGACIAHTGVTVCVTGDGSLMTNIHDLATLKHNNLNIKLVVVNNDGYLSIRNTQNQFFNGNLVGTSQPSGVFIPSLEKLAETFEIPYIRCDNCDALDKAISDTLKIDGPVMIEVIGMDEQRIIPAVQSIKLADGRMQSKPLHDMFPFLSNEEIEEQLNAVDQLRR